MAAFFATYIVSAEIKSQIKPQKAVENAQQIIHKLQSLTLRELNQVFDEYDLCNQLISNLVLTAQKLLEIDPEAI